MTKFTTIEKLTMQITPCYGAVLRLSEQVFVTDLDRNGNYYAKIYEMVDVDDAPSMIEARLSLIAEASEHFEDSGHAIEWCFNNA